MDRQDNIKSATAGALNYGVVIWCMKLLHNDSADGFGLHYK